MHPRHIIQLDHFQAYGSLPLVYGGYDVFDCYFLDENVGDYTLKKAISWILVLSCSFSLGFWIRKQICPNDRAGQMGFIRAFFIDCKMLVLLCGFLHS